MSEHSQPLAAARAGQPDVRKNMRARRGEVLPSSLPPRGLSREMAAAYVGISPTMFDQMVKDGRMPPAKRINARTVWDRRKLDAAFDALPDGEELDHQNDPWSRVAV